MLHLFVGKRSWLTLLLVVACMLIARSAPAVQSSASISVIPDLTTATLSNGETFEVEVVLNNTSSNTPPSGLDPVKATVSGPITVTFGCTDCACAAVNSQNLVFVPGPASGCASKVGDVTSCQGMGSNEVLIHLDANGVEVPPDSSLSIARLTLQAVNIGSAPPATLGIRAMTGVCAVQACSGPFGDQAPCVTCAAEGCSRVSFVAGQQVQNCPHACVNKIIFKQNGPDFFEYHGIVVVPANFDASASPFQVSLVNQDGATLFDFSLPAGSLTDQGSTFTYQDPNAQNGGGIAFVKAAERTDAPNAYRIDIQVYAPALDAGTTNPDRSMMTTTFSIGGQTFSTVETWTRKNFGWQLNEH